LLIGIFGATVGIMAGFGFGFVLTKVVSSSNSGSSSEPIYLAGTIAMIWILSVGLSVIAGVLPAIKASRLLPIKALRSQ
ncbi:MAG: ABC transporter permease, partial [Candidatus Nitrosocosmicus sp.]